MVGHIIAALRQSRIVKTLEVLELVEEEVEEVLTELETRLSRRE